jgi:uncharacterized protein (TIGR03083 family)
MDDRSASAFADASAFFVDTVAFVAQAAWERPGLGEWTVRQLVAHANRAQTTVVQYVQHPEPPEGRDSGYLGADAIAARGRDAVASLGEDPVEAVRAASVAAIELIKRSSPATSVGSPMGTMSLARYLPSRTAELVIHTLDLARAIDEEVSPPLVSLEETLGFVARRAAQRSPQQVLLALSGRAPLPTGYSVF